jgi:hypothetical protein
MNMLLHGGLVSFLIGILLSLPLAAVHYNQSPPWAGVFANPRKLKSAHLDFFMQALAAGFAYTLERASGSALPMFIFIPLLYGTIGNPLILLLESIANYRIGLMGVFYRFLRATSPALLMLAWFMIGGLFLPVYAWIFLAVFTAAGTLIVWRHRRKNGNGEA